MSKVKSCVSLIIVKSDTSSFYLNFFVSVQKTREVDHIPAQLHEVPTHQTEAETARDPKGEGVWL